jgi:hypothetical protein
MQISHELEMCPVAIPATGFFHGGFTMCDYSLQTVKSRPAKVADRLCVTDFGTGTRGFSVIDADQNGKLERLAACVLPGTEIAFDDPVALALSEVVNGVALAGFKQTEHKLARFRQINKDIKHTHHDVIEFPDGKQVMLTHLQINQYVTVLQLPAVPKTEAEAAEQKRAEYVG